MGPYQQVVFTGDSLTHAFEVQNFCKEFGPDGPIAYNRGISGYTTLDLLSALDVMVTDIKPRRLFFNIGTNDIGWTGNEMLMDRIDYILNIIEEEVPGVEIVLTAYYPYPKAQEPEDYDGGQNPYAQYCNERRDDLNVLLQQMAEKHGAKYKDFSAPITDEEGYMQAEYHRDGVHINDAGYRQLWPLFKEAILADWNDL